MANDNIDLLSIDHGTVTAPAGCGKTHLITEAVGRHSGEKPILVLTHTNAGVAALRQRLNRASVPPKAYVLSTIDGWAMRLISTFPARSGHASELLELRQPGSDYLQIRDAAAGLLGAGHIDDVIEASYVRLIVDEYQDCSVRQHAIVAGAALILPTCVLGDPLQAIFGFGGDGLPSWDEQVCACFPVVAELGTPWRWVNVHAESLGYWLLDVREKLLRGEEVDLRTAPDAVSWVELDGTADRRRCLMAARTRPPDRAGSVLIIGESTNPTSQRKFASQTPGAVTVEAVDLRDLTSFARAFNVTAGNALPRLLGFAQSLMTNVRPSDVIRRVQSLAKGRARNPPNAVEQAALAFVAEPSYQAALGVLVELHEQADTRTYRPAVYRACVNALRLCNGSDGITFHDATLRMREEYRFAGRALPKRAVGSTLLLKGLEADVVVVLNASSLNARNLYVAMTRGSQSVVVCSPTPILDPKW